MPVPVHTGCSGWDPATALIHNRRAIDLAPLADAAKNHRRSHELRRDHAHLFGHLLGRRDLYDDADSLGAPGPNWHRHAHQTRLNAAIRLPLSFGFRSPDFADLVLVVSSRTTRPDISIPR